MCGVERGTKKDAVDIATVRRLGGRLAVTENLPEGAPRCVFEITRFP
jgi:hypothetical protein